MDKKFDYAYWCGRMEGVVALFVMGHLEKDYAKKVLDEFNYEFNKWCTYLNKE